MPFKQDRQLNSIQVAMNSNLPFVPPFIATPSFENLLQMVGFPQTATEIDWFGLLGGSSDKPRGNMSSHLETGGFERDGDCNKVGGMGRRRVPWRVAFHTRSADDVLDDGYRWRKYGQKAVKNSSHPRSYYRCTHHTCKVKKQVQRLAWDSGVVVTTYEGVHNHPCEKMMESLAPILSQLHLLTRF